MIKKAEILKALNEIVKSEKLNIKIPKSSKKSDLEALLQRLQKDNNYNSDDNNYNSDDNNYNSDDSNISIPPPSPISSVSSISSNEIQKILDDTSEDEKTEDESIEEDEKTETIRNISSKVKKPLKAVNGSGNAELKIKELIKKYKSNLGLKLKPFQLKHRQGKLYENDKDKLVNLYNKLKSDLLDNIDKITKNASLSESFYNDIETQIEAQEQRVKTII